MRRGAVWTIALAGAALGAFVVLRWRDRARPEPADATDLAETLAAIDPESGMAVRDLGDGIFELVGEAEAGVALRAARALRQLPGVRVVLNRVWSEFPAG